MQFLLLIYGSEQDWDALPEAETQAIYGEYAALSRNLRDEGKLVGGEELQPTATATTVSVRDRETVVSDGPFAETKEALGGYYLIEAESMDEAIAWAARIPSARDGAIEVRPLYVEESAES